MVSWHIGPRLALLAMVSLLADALTAGTWGGTHWKIIVNSDQTTGSIEGDCSLGTISDFATSGAGVVSFSSQLVLQFETQVTKSLTCTDGALNSAGTELSGTLTVGTYTESFKVTLNAEPDLYKCVNAALPTAAGWHGLVLSGLVMMHLWRLF